MSIVDIFSESDFDSMFFNPYGIKGSILKKYPKIKMFKSFLKADDKLIRYVLYVYDLNTPLKEYYPDLKIRKEEAAKLSGYDLAKDKDFLYQIFFFKKFKNFKIDKKFLKKKNKLGWVINILKEKNFFEIQNKITQTLRWE